MFDWLGRWKEELEQYADYFQAFDEFFKELLDKIMEMMGNIFPKIIPK